jgi:tRNA pseudouridine55 synthase
MNGWIILDKPSGVFSKSASNRVARIFGTKKNGHIGTLDPMASGVLPIAIGAATKMVPFLEEFSDRTKEYIFSVRFGFETDTLDITGQEINRCDTIPTADQVRSILAKFIGHISQIPPMFSAIHIDGRRAYEIARSGQNPEIPPRDVDIYSLELLDSVENRWMFKMSCSPGTYVRSVARDIAKNCGTLATVDMIRRTRTCGFTLKNAHSLDFLENLFNNGADVGEYLAPIDLGLGDIPVLDIGDRVVGLYRAGGFIGVDCTDGLRRVYSGKTFVGIGVVTNGVLRPKRTI